MFDNEEDLSNDVATVVSSVRAAIVSPACTLVNRPKLYPKAFALAALSHTCVLLERLDAERNSGDDLVARVLVRAHWEAYIVAAYLFYGGWDAYIQLAGAARRALSVQNARVAEANQRELKKREKIKATNADRAKQNRGIAAHNLRTGESVPLRELLAVPVDATLEFDLGPILDKMSSIPESRFSIEDMERRAFELAAEVEGEDLRELSNYDFLYRSLSYLGAHPTHWVLEQYLRIPGLMVHIAPKADTPALASLAVRSGVGLTANLAAKILGSFGCDVSVFDVIVDRWVERAARNRGLRALADLLAARIARKASSGEN